MRIKGLIALLIVILGVSLSGCQLALEGAGEWVNDDRLIGAFITTEYLDLFDFERYLEDNIGKISGGGIVIDDSAKPYEGRLYAKLKERVLTNEDTGEKIYTEEYVFEDVSGVSYFVATIPEADGRESYVTSGSDEAISDGQTGLFRGDNEDKITLEGTIYISSIGNRKSHYINPVYQSPDGRVYAMSGQGISMSGVQAEGAAFSQTLEETSTTRENGKNKEVSTSVKISIEVMLPPERIVILQMDKNSSILSSREYSPGQVPDKLTPIEETDYIIVETYKRDLTGDVVVTRELFSKEDDTLFTFSCRDDGICVKKWTELLWDSNVKR